MVWSLWRDIEVAVAVAVVVAAAEEVDILRELKQVRENVCVLKKAVEVLLKAVED